jgi:hypothetical protein
VSFCGEKWYEKTIFCGEKGAICSKPGNISWRKRVKEKGNSIT